jgi:hypothetical protein
MAKRILPYRDYSEHDVVNLFSLDVSDAALTAYDTELSGFLEAESGEWDSGVVVSVYAGELPGDLPDVRATTLAATDKLQKYLSGANLENAYVGINAYPSNGMTVRPASAGSRGLGITLRETLAYDENGEKMLYYKQKLDEAFAVLPGHSVPVLTRGTVLLTSGTGGAIPAGADVGDDLEVGANGTLVVPAGDSTAPVVGKVIAEGYEVKKGAQGASVKKLLCQLSF